MGYNRAGFDVVGVDIVPQPRYPFEFIQADAVEFLSNGVDGFDAIHASPPCQRYCSLNRGWNENFSEHPDMVGLVRMLLQRTGLPYVIENVPAAPLDNPVTLCGEMYGLSVIRHRKFETNWELPQPEHRPHRGNVSGRRHGKVYRGPYVAIYGHGGGKGTLEVWREAMDVWWMESRYEIAQSVPPAYSEYIGRELLKLLSGDGHDVGITPSHRAEAYCSQCGRRTSPALANS